MNTGTKRAARMAAAVVLGAAGVAAAPTAAHADASACAVTPAPGVYGDNVATASCPAGAGTFTYRVVATCVDFYPSPNGVYWQNDGPWVQAGAASATSSTAYCYGYAPGSGFVWSATIQTQ